MTLWVTVNGSPRELAPGATVAGIVDELTGERRVRGVAVAVDGEVVPRGAWCSTPVSDGAEIEVVQAVQGG
jgi:sulfur carrier protein